MATVIRTTPRGTYGTQEGTGALVPYVETGVVDMPGQAVAIYEDSTGALLGSGAASDTPNASGQYAGWYAYSIPILAWTTTAGISLSGAEADGSTGSVRLSAVVPVSGAQSTSSTGSIAIVLASQLNLTGATALGVSGGTSIAAVVPVAGAASTGSTGSVSITSGAGGGGSSLVPADPTFALTSAFPTTAAVGAWWKSEQPATVDVDPPGTASVTRGVTAPAWFTGSTKVAKLSAQAGLGYDYNPVSSYATLSFPFAKATIDAGSLVTFDFGSNAPSLNLTRLDVEVLNGSGTSIIDKTTQRNSLLLFAGSWGTADGTTIAKPLTTNTKQTATFDLKTWASARLLGGNTWDGNVSSVSIVFVCGSDSDASESILYVGNFR